MNRVGTSFPRRLRLTHATDYRQVFENNFRRSDNCVTILIASKGNQIENPRLGFAVAKKQIAKAVQRNRLKRIFRESFRMNQHRLPTRDMVVMVRRNILLIDNKELTSNLEKHWNSIIEKCENS